MEPILKIQNLTNHFNGEKVLANVNLSMKKGEILCLLGSSGSGKTTLLRMISGLEQATSGQIHFAGKNLCNIPPHKRNIGMMFQEYALFPHKSVRDNIVFGLQMKQYTPAEQQKIADSMLELVGLEGFGNRRINELSGGEQQRVALARSLAPKPDLLLLDEPLGSLDRILRERLTGELRKIIKSVGVTAIFVTHDQAEAFTISDTVAVLRNGRVEQINSPENLYRFPANEAVAKFLGFQNFIEGNVNSNGQFSNERRLLNGLKLQSGGLEGKVTLLIRPDAATITHCSPEDVHGQKPLLTGTIIQCRFQGSTYKVVLNCQETRLSFDLPLEPKIPTAGEVTVSINPSAIHILH